MQQKNMARKLHFYPDCAITQIRPICPTSTQTARTRDNNWNQTILFTASTVNLWWPALRYSNWQLFVLDSKIQNQANS